MKLTAFVIFLYLPAISFADVKALEYFSTPQAKGPVEVVSAIDKAKLSVRMWMFSMNNRAVADSLVAAAKRGVKVEVIFNHAMFTKMPLLIAKLRDGGVKVVEGSKEFSITHAKTLVFDNSYALITTMNLTSAYRLTRDAGVRIEDAEVLRDLNALFEADLANAKSGTGDTPVSKSAALVVSPTNSLPRLLSLIDSAKSEILASVENFSDGPISEHLTFAASKGVTVKVLSPSCSLNSNPFFNFEVLEILAKKSVQVRVPASPASADSPYIHQKIILVDGKRLYIGSVNFTYNSMKKAREIGIIADAAPVLKEVMRDFNADWKGATSLPPRPPGTCLVYGKNERRPTADFLN